MASRSEQVEVVIAETFRIRGRGTAATLAEEPKPWWPLSTHRVRVVKPDGVVFQTDACVELALKNQRDFMALLFPQTEPTELPSGSRVTSLVLVQSPKSLGKSARKWWQFWRP